MILISNVNCREPGIVGLFYGEEKSSDSNKFLYEFVQEAGSCLKEKEFVSSCALSSVMSRPYIKSYIKCVKGHNGYCGCGYCVHEGFYNGRMVFLETNFPLRTDASFRNFEQEHHHKHSISEELKNLEMVQDFPNDPMHPLFLGVVRKILLNLLKGPLTVKLSGNKKK